MLYKDSGADHAQRILNEYEAARERNANGFCLYVRMYCPNSDCAVRHFTIELGYQSVGGYKIVHPFACPYCGQFAVLDAYATPAIETQREYNQRKKCEARQSVWRQIRHHRTRALGILASDMDKEVDIAQLAELLDQAERAGRGEGSKK
jgi:hypothetical protein